MTNPDNHSGIAPAANVPGNIPTVTPKIYFPAPIRPTNRYGMIRPTKIGNIR